MLLISDALAVGGNHDQCQRGSYQVAHLAPSTIGSNYQSKARCGAAVLECDNHLSITVSLHAFHTVTPLQLLFWYGVKQYLSESLAVNFWCVTSFADLEQFGSVLVKKPEHSRIIAGIPLEFLEYPGLLQRSLSRARVEIECAALFVG